jgi:hypothetical protein
MSIYEILPALDLTQSVHAKISIGMHRGVKLKIFRIPLIGLETRLGWRTDRKFLRNPNLNVFTALMMTNNTVLLTGSTMAITFTYVTFCHQQQYSERRYDNVTLSPLLLQQGLRIGPIQRNGAAPGVSHTGRFFVLIPLKWSKKLTEVKNKYI